MSFPRILLFVICVYLAGFFAHALLVGKTVYGDGAYYYSWLRSIAIDHDLDFRNDYRLFDITQNTTRVGLVGNIYPVGPALFWWPLFTAIDVVVRGRGISLPYQMGIGIGGVWFAAVGLLLVYRTLRKFSTEAISIASLLAIAFGTNLWFYGSLDTVNSHAISFALATIFLSLWLLPKRNDFALGIVLGSMALVRPQDALYGVLLFERATTRSLFINGVGFLLAFTPQLAAWQIVYGKFWVNPYLDRGYGFDFLHPNMLGTLFSPNNGLFLWTPVTLLGFVGLCLKDFPKPQYRPYFITVILLEIYLVASWTTWWQGASYSGRMFVSVLPILAIGLTHFIRHFWGQARIGRLLPFVVPLCLINGILIVMYLFNH